MGIRRYKKDHLREAAQPLAVVPAPVASAEPASNEPLRFWTSHKEKPVLVDLEVFALGQQEGPSGTWLGPFTGRPQLIAELAPALHATLGFASESSVSQFNHSLRTWWRLLDALEATAPGASAPLPRVEKVSDLGDLHRQRAMDAAMDRFTFAPFYRMVNLVRKAQGLRPFHWQLPEQASSRRHLPPLEHVNRVRFALKRGWFAAHDRWELADSLLAGTPPQNDEQLRLLKNYQRFRAVVGSVGHPRPGSRPIWGEWSSTQFNRQGYNIPEMLRGFYPDAVDIRMAFCLCLASTGFNPSVLLSLDATKPFIESHPKDPSRYLLWAHKARGNSDQVTEGLFKSQGSPGVIIQTLIRRTKPLRDQLVKDLASLRAKDEELSRQGATSAERDRSKKAIVRLEQGIRSPWLYVVPGTELITWLNRETYTSVSSEAGAGSFLDDVIAGINAKEPIPERRITARLTPSDFRDAFAAYAYQMSGGAVLYVMKVLGHKQPTTTQDYLDNTLLNDESNRLYRTFSNALWHEIKVYGRADPTLVAKWSRDGNVSEEERERLARYRALKRSRLGVGCKDPTSPPKRIAPGFKADGKAECPVQRCTLCLENAVLFPDSVDGLCKRLAELRAIQSQMASLAFMESSFGEEMQNTELALQHFDPKEVAALLDKWQGRIERGEHRALGFEGTEVMA